MTSLTIEICRQTHNEHEISNEKSEPDEHKSKSKISETREVNRVVRDTNRDKSKRHTLRFQIVTPPISGRAHKLA